MRLVRMYARNVRSEARWSLATLPEFSRIRVGFHEPSQLSFGLSIKFRTSVSCVTTEGCESTQASGSGLARKDESADVFEEGHLCGATTATGPVTKGGIGVEGGVSRPFREVSPTSLVAISVAPYELVRVKIGECKSPARQRIRGCKNNIRDSSNNVAVIRTRNDVTGRYSTHSYRP